MPFAAGRVHKKFVASNGSRVIPRAARREDLAAVTSFADCVLSSNPGAFALYEGLEFKHAGVIEDQIREEA
jgi:hypothetical protein